MLTILACFFLIIVSAWIAGALYYDVGQSTKYGGWLVVVWVVIVCAVVFLMQPIWHAVLVIAAIFIFVLAWWFTQKPSNYRNWDPSFSKLCKIEIDDDKVLVHNLRCTEYRTLQDYDLTYEQREYRLSDLRFVDVLILFWGTSWMSHPMAIFDFGNNQHVCFSIEVRYQEGQPYNILRAIYRQYELMYVVSDERDAILRRTKYSENHDCYLYRLQKDVGQVRQLFMEYVGSTNQLVESPRWYHALTQNCTTSILSQRTEKMGFDRRMILNGSFDQFLYDRGRLYDQLPFDELKNKSRINEAANRAEKNGFSAAIRKDLPGFDPPKN